ncbi:DODA-type extradiol aromatic ring-opening family dioxygenase [Paenibacillus chibensis]|uniref:DODA-type extradiol aromatic ring-opening family dioxygenase n=1 Tax=Paenibacillus chibensis TaxID=59846 RepID=UPI000FD97264|nr:class III extradiol ring-cleavage dioxygenase [Paenibacillus chibensis]MEC0372227.1 class III extradiol ring-cleavage dioxygenase [Paenibacillus chibensis]
MLSPVFLAHGSPFTLFEESEFTRFLKRFGQENRPKAIVIFSAHFESETTTIAATDDVHEMVYDYYGFPEPFYQVKYPAKGSKVVASIVEERLKRNHIPVQMKYRGLDHGVFPIMMHAYPEADIPIIPVSVNPFLPARQQIAIGEALKGLEEEGILVIGSGFVSHNLREFDRDKDATPRVWALEFRNWIREKVTARDIEALSRYDVLAPHAAMAVPRAEHFVPLLIALGSGSASRDVRVLFDTIEHGTGTTLSFQF